MLRNLSIGILSLFTSLNAIAGAQTLIPIELIHQDNLARSLFLSNAIRASHLNDEPVGTVKYKDFQSFVIGGDENGSTYDYGYFGLRVTLSTKGHLIRCEQKILVGNFEQDISGPVSCVEVN